MNKPCPTVTIIIPVFNRSATLMRAVRSCLLPDPSVEVMVVDDGSSEDILTALKTAFPTHLETGTIRLLTQSNQGACVARNRGLAQATGEFVKFLDSDDTLIPSSLPEEVEAARASECDALLTGWEERTFLEDGTEKKSRRHTRSVPDLSRGIDDMLEGIAPWTSAALYRTEFVRPLRWDPNWTKAQDWGWALTVCLAGAQFVSLDRPSCIYNHHPGARISHSGDIQIRSTQARQHLLRMVEKELRAQNALTDSRKCQLAQYYYRDCQILARNDPGEWRRVWTHCQDLCTGFRPRDPNRIMRLFTHLLGIHTGVRAYVRLKDMLLPSRIS